MTPMDKGITRDARLSGGEHLWSGLDLPTLGDECARQAAGERATHVFLRRRA